MFLLLKVFSLYSFSEAVLTPYSKKDYGRSTSG